MADPETGRDADPLPAALPSPLALATLPAPAGSAAPTAPTATKVLTTLAALRAQGAHRTDPVRFHLAEALARKATGHRGTARRVLDEKLAALLETVGQRADHADRADRVARIEPPMISGASNPPPPSSPLAQLLIHLAQQKPATTSNAPAAAPAMSTHPPSSTHDTRPQPALPDDATLQFFRRTWSRLNADQRLAQSRASLPQNAGPINSQQLVHRSLTRMHELSPAYLEQFVSYVDGLLWLEQTFRESTRRTPSSAAPPARDAPAPPRRAGSAARPGS